MKFFLTSLGEGLSIAPPSFAPLPRPFSQREKGGINQVFDKLKSDIILRFNR